MISENITIQFSSGLHLRPVTILSETACRYRSKASLLYDDRDADMKSVLSLLASGLRRGDEATLVCEGEDEKEAFQALMKIFASDP
jgi:phosphocarrier protein HPr